MFVFPRAVYGRDVRAHVEAPLEQDPMHPGRNTVTYEARMLKSLLLQVMWRPPGCLWLPVNLTDNYHRTVTDFYRATLCVSAVLLAVCQCPFVTLVYCIQTAVGIIKDFSWSHSPVILGSWSQPSGVIQFQGEPAQRGVKYTSEDTEAVTGDACVSKTQHRHIDKSKMGATARSKKHAAAGSGLNSSQSGCMMVRLIWKAVVDVLA